MISADFKGTKLHIGDTVKVNSTVTEGAKTRVQTFEGIILSLRGRGDSKSFTVRHIGNRGVGIERTWPLNANVLVGITVVKTARKVRRAKLYFLRNLVSKMSSAV